MLSESPVSSLGGRIGSEGRQELLRHEISSLNPSIQHGKFPWIVAVVHPHIVSRADVSIVCKSAKTAHAPTIARSGMSELDRYRRESIASSLHAHRAIGISADEDDFPFDLGTTRARNLVSGTSQVLLVVRNRSSEGRWEIQHHLGDSSIGVDERCSNHGLVGNWE